jgi:superoxide dismutase, Fe-Mn family
MGTEIKQVLDVLATLDKKGHAAEVNVLDAYLRKSAKKGVHKCGLEDATINAHRELMEKYRKNANSLAKEKKKVFLSSNEKDNSSNSKLRTICRDISHNENAAFLHEMYFQDCVDNKPCSIEKTKFLKDSLGNLYIRSAKDFQKDIKRMAKLSRNGWLLMSFCTESRDIHLEIVDLHEVGHIACKIPIAALDMWEHAYFADFGLDTEAYVDWWLSQMDWRNPEKRLKNLLRLK